MPFEDFDHKAREAARQHRPAYEPAAWEKMQQMLDKHMPEKKNDRRPLFFFLLLFLLAGSGIWVITAKPWQKTAQANATENDKLQNDKGGTSWTTPSSADVRGKTQEPVVVINNTVNAQTIAEKPALESLLKPVMTTIPGIPIAEQSHTNPLQQEHAKSSQQLISANTEIKNNETKIEAEPKLQEPANKLSDDPVMQTGEMASASLKQTKASKNSFSFSLTAGAGVSSSEGGSTGRIKPTLGAGITYTIKDRLSIRTGFYSGHKVYVSEPYEYHPPDIFWTYYPNLQQVDADCKVYEIPLSLAYHFGRSSRQNWFVSTGVSTYLMKHETYKFLYKNSAGQLNTRTWDFDNDNQHYFSTLTLSGGYQRSLGKSWSVSVEPYMKLPLSGVGYGKVKLNSAGVLVSLEFKPFRKY